MCVCALIRCAILLYTELYSLLQCLGEAGAPSLTTDCFVGFFSKTDGAKSLVDTVATLSDVVADMGDCQAGLVGSAGAAVDGCAAVDGPGCGSYPTIGDASVHGECEPLSACDVIA